MIKEFDVNDDILRNVKRFNNEKLYCYSYFVIN